MASSRTILAYLAPLLLVPALAFAQPQDKKAKKGQKAQPAAAAPKAPAASGQPEATSGEKLKSFTQQTEEETTQTSTVAEKGDDVEPGEPGSRISQDESTPPKPMTAQEIEAAQSKEDQLKMLEKEAEYYRLGAEGFANDVKDWIRLQYNAQKEMLASQYDRRVEELENEERARRLEAIARFEDFLKKYPNDPQYTPDAMFRLAELYFEKSSDEYLALSKAYEKGLQAYERGERPDEPQPPEPHYEKTIGLHLDLLARFPKYRLADAANYLVGYCYSEQTQSDEALKYFQALVDNYPNSKFQAEVWTRIGEIYFDKNDVAALKKAIDAYAKVRQFKDSPYYDKALYKIAWTYYRLDKYQEAVAAFIELVTYADEQKKLTGKTGSELRAEAIQYVGVSLADETWGGFERAKEVLAPYGNKPFVGEIWKRYGEILYDQTRYPLAIQVLDYTLQRQPNAPFNPEVQAKIVNSYEQNRDFDGATAAREKLVKNYSEGSEWFRVNKDNREAIAQAKALTEKSLYTAAIFRHQQAQAFKQAGRADDARRSYQAAAQAYKGYLAQFPNAKNSYDFEFFLAECLYYSEDYMAAAAQYDKVRDSPLDNKHLEQAALSSVITYQKEVESETASGKLPKCEVLTKEQRKGKTLEPKKIEPIYQKLLDASDRYVRLLPNGKDSPPIAYKAAETYYCHDQLEEARKRFEQIVAAWPDTEVGGYAANLIIESYLAVDDYVNVEKYAARLQDNVKKTPPKPLTADQEKQRKDLESKLAVFKLGAQFKQAEAADSGGRFEEAADKYVQLVNENPKHEFASKALFNAAVDYEKVKRFETASNTYQRVADEYPKSDLAPKALFRVGVNYEKGYDFPSAIQAYTKLVERYPQSENRADALYNEAVTLENMQNYAQAAQAFKKYATTFEKREDAGENFFRSALVYEKMNAFPEEIDTLKAFVAKYKNAGPQKERIVEAYRRMGTAYDKQKNEKEALNAYAQCVKEFGSRHISTDRPASAEAAQCALELAESDFRKYDEVRITGSGKKLQQNLELKAKMQQKVEKEYTEVFKYKRAETTLAASYRIGHAYERFAESMFNADVPPEIQKAGDEAVGIYRELLEQKAAVLEKKAEQAYRKALDEAKKSHVTNEWTDRIMEGLHKYQPGEFPVQRSGKSVMQTVTISGNPLDTLNQSAPKTKPPASGSNEAIKPAEGQRRAEAKGEKQ
jgi:tetratricopeptide (TPR) repeat protein